MKRLRDYYVIACGAGLLHAAACTSGPAGVPPGDSPAGAKGDADIGNMREGTSFGSSHAMAPDVMAWLVEYAQQAKRDAIEDCKTESDCSLEVRIHRVSSDALAGKDPTLDPPVEAVVATTIDQGPPVRHVGPARGPGGDAPESQPVFYREESEYPLLAEGVRMGVRTSDSRDVVYEPCDLSDFDPDTASTDYSQVGEVYDVSCGSLTVTFSMDLPAVHRSFREVHFPYIRDLNKAANGRTKCNDYTGHGCYWDTNEGGYGSMPDLTFAILSAQNELVTAWRSPVIAADDIADSLWGLSRKPGVASTQGASPFMLFSLPAALATGLGAGAAASAAGASIAQDLFVSEVAYFGTLGVLASIEGEAAGENERSALVGAKGDVLAVFEYDEDKPASNIPVALCALENVAETGTCDLKHRSDYPDRLISQLGENEIPRLDRGYHFMEFL